MKPVIRGPQAQQIFIWCAKKHKYPYHDSTHFNKNELSLSNMNKRLFASQNY